MKDLAWDDLRYFLAFARAGGLQAAATRLGVNQSTVQRRISELEERVGRRLIERQLGGYRLTALGKTLQPAAQDIEAAVAAFERLLASCDHELNGTIRLTCGPSVAARLQSTTLIDSFHARHPGLRIELVITDRVLDLSKREADLAIRAGEPKDDALVVRKIGDASWSVYASRAYLKQHGRPDDPDDLSGHFVVGCGTAIVDYPSVQWQRSVEHQATVIAQADHLPAVILAVKAGTGLGAMLQFQGESESELVRVIDDIGLVTPYYLVMHRDMQRTPRVRAFAEFVAAEIRSFRELLSGSSEG